METDLMDYKNYIDLNFNRLIVKNSGPAFEFQSVEKNLKGINNHINALQSLKKNIYLNNDLKKIMLKA